MGTGFGKMFVWTWRAWCFMSLSGRIASRALSHLSPGV